MKKQILICGLAALAATTMLFAANDKLTFFKGSKKVRTIRVDDISEITYTDPEDGGFKKMRVAFSGAEPRGVSRQPAACGCGASLRMRHTPHHDR